VSGILQPIKKRRTIIAVRRNYYGRRLNLIRPLRKGAQRSAEHILLAVVNKSIIFVISYFVYNVSLEYQ